MLVVSGLKKFWHARFLPSLKKLAVAAKNPYNERQLIEIGLNIIKNSGDFEDAQRRQDDETG